MGSLKIATTKKFILLTTLLFLSRCYDFITTIIYTPDLANESNPFVILLNLNVFTSGVVQLLVTSIVAYFLYIYCFKFVKIENLGRNISIKEYVGLYNFNDAKGWEKMFYKLPTNKNALFYALGYILTYSLIIIGFVVGTSTTLLIISEEYEKIYRYNYSGRIFLYSFIVLTLLYFSYRFYKNGQRKINH
ncbi:MAG: hypothetical protein K0B10_05545 [Vicingaceae bacterium]|nr:hypothetical protein [Vicingaceae bacterium]